MPSRAPLVLAVVLFVVGSAGFLAMAANHRPTTPFLGRPRDNPTTAPIDLRSVPQPQFPSLPSATASPTPVATPPVTSIAAAPSPEPTATPEPRPPLVFAAIASDASHALSPSPTAGPLRITMVGRDDGAPPGASSTATPSPEPTPILDPEPVAVASPDASATGGQGDPPPAAPATVTP